MGDSYIPDVAAQEKSSKKLPRKNPSANPNSYSFNEIRKELGISTKSANGEWREFRRQVREEISIAKLRSIDRRHDPQLLQSKTLKVARKLIKKQPLWKKVSASVKKQEELACWLIGRECSLVGESSGFANEEDEYGNPISKHTWPIFENKPSSHRMSTKKIDDWLTPKDEGSEFELQSDLKESNNRKRKRSRASPKEHPQKKNEALISTRDTNTGKETRSKAGKTQKTLVTFNASEYEKFDDSFEDTSQAVDMIDTTRIEESDDTPKPRAEKARNISTSLARRRELHEIKMFQLKLEELQLQMEEKKEAFEKKYGVSYEEAATE